LKKWTSVQMIKTMGTLMPTYKKRKKKKGRIR
jgi:hypothetical protein